MTKRISWLVAIRILREAGWRLTERSKQKFEFRRNSQRILVFKSVIGWKVEYLISGRLQDSTLARNEKEAKVLVMQLAVLT